MNKIKKLRCIIWSTPIQIKLKIYTTRIIQHALNKNNKFIFEAKGTYQKQIYKKEFSV